MGTRIQNLDVDGFLLHDAITLPKGRRSLTPMHFQERHTLMAWLSSILTVWQVPNAAVVGDLYLRSPSYHRSGEQSD